MEGVKTPEGARVNGKLFTFTTLQEVRLWGRIWGRSDSPSDEFDTGSRSQVSFVFLRRSAKLKNKLLPQCGDTSETASLCHNRERGTGLLQQCFGSFRSHFPHP